jgi:hypothetical protein
MVAGAAIRPNGFAEDFLGGISLGAGLRAGLNPGLGVGLLSGFLVGGLIVGFLVSGLTVGDFGRGIRCEGRTSFLLTSNETSFWEVGSEVARNEDRIAFIPESSTDDDAPSPPVPSFCTPSLKTRWNQSSGMVSTEERCTRAGFPDSSKNDFPFVATAFGVCRLTKSVDSN